jgi:hypothetical protein
VAVDSVVAAALAASEAAEASEVAAINTASLSCVQQCYFLVATFSFCLCLKQENYPVTVLFMHSCYKM